MTKDEAIIELRNGKVLRHRFFTDEEYVFEKDGLYHFEDGVKCKPSEFWGYRIDISWDTDWELVNRPSPNTEQPTGETENDKAFRISEEIFAMYKQLPPCNLKKHLDGWFGLSTQSAKSEDEIERLRKAGYALIHLHLLIKDKDDSINAPTPEKVQKAIDEFTEALDKLPYIEPSTKSNPVNKEEVIKWIGENKTQIMYVGQDAEKLKGIFPNGTDFVNVDKLKHFLLSLPSTQDKGEKCTHPKEWCYKSADGSWCEKCGEQFS